MYKHSLTLLFFLLGTLMPVVVLSQQVPQKLAAALKTFHQDPQLRNAISSLYVQDAKTGKVLFDHNGQVGLVPASTLKVVTAASAYALLGKNFRYETKFAWQKKGEGTSVYISPSGDPTFGSWRWSATGEGAVLKGLALALSEKTDKSVTEVLVGDGSWESGTIPVHWLWQDLGNYYGAGAAGFNWRENQYDVFLKSGKNIGDPVSVIRTVPKLEGYTLQSEVTSAAASSGDSAYIYFPLHGSTGIIRGSIPANRNSFKISGAMPDAAAQFAAALQGALAEAGIKRTGKAVVTAAELNSGPGYADFHTVTSPPLDSMVYWFNRKSVNLYGEAFVKTIAQKHRGVGATAKGISTIISFWKNNGIEAGELNIVDGSGLSPVNRVTTHALVSCLQYAGKQPWYGGFYHSLPLLNGMKMKSGTMRGVKGFTGYYRDKAGNEYVFSFLVNNYAGTSAAITRKMYTVLDVLK